MKALLTVLIEQIKSFYLVRRLSFYEMKISNNSNYLGILWEVINPMIQISIYWFVFGYGIREGKDVNGVPYLQWMLAGIIVWFFVNPSIIEGTKSVYRRIKMLSKMSFPMSVIPTYVIISKFYQHLMLIIIITVIMQFFGFPINFYYIQLPYFMFATIALLLAVTLITSTLAMIIRDMAMLVQALMRMFLYLTPILWTPDRLPDFIQRIMKINPLYYIIEGYRASILGREWYIIDHAEYTLYFWVVVLFLMTIGSVLHVKFRSHFIDFM